MGEAKRKGDAAAKAAAEEAVEAASDARSRWGHIEGLLTREDVQTADDLTWEIVEVPEWKTAVGADKVIVQALSGEARDEWEAWVLARNDGNEEANVRRLRSKLVQMSVVDPTDGQFLFSIDDVEWLGKKNGHALQRIFATAARISHMTKTDLDELTRNLGETPSDSSPTTSPTPSVERDGSSSET